MGRSPLDDVTEAVKDAAYVSVGLAVIAFQRLQVRRAELAKALGEPGGEARGAVEAIGGLLGDHLKVLEERLSAALARK